MSLYITKHTISQYKGDNEMANLFSGLEALGLGSLSNLDVYEENTKANETEKKAQQEPQEVDFLFEKTYTCPVCDQGFKSKTVKTSKVKLLAIETDLRPKYKEFDTLKYDVVACPHCGYAALDRYFNFLTSTQLKLVKENISASFKGFGQQGDVVSYEEAISYYKLALINTIVKKGKMSERAYTCLKSAWVLRGMADSLPSETTEEKEKIAALKAEEDDFIAKAYEGFTVAVQKESFPMCGMDDITVTYLMADLARRCGKRDEALRLLSSVIVSREANERMKERARQLKELMK